MGDVGEPEGKRLFQVVPVDADAEIGSVDCGLVERNGRFFLGVLDGDLSILDDEVRILLTFGRGGFDMGDDAQRIGEVDGRAVGPLLGEAFFPLGEAIGDGMVADCPVPGGELDAGFFLFRMDGHGPRGFFELLVEKQF